MPIDHDELRHRVENNGKKEAKRPTYPPCDTAAAVDSNTPSEKAIAPVDINQEAREGGEHAIARKVEILHDAQRRGRHLADEEAVTELTAYVQQANKRQSQMKQFMQSYRQGLNGALSSIAVDLPEADEDFFVAVPEFSLPSNAASLLKGSR